ncbi:glycerophosphodiester phosphodiesterase family protein [Paenibacillus sedimenti]|uniref:Glycerophosphodiester phosphodiesterase n=1 Tax=Paenibacillus sedimenti TaxID=2770274 RepID=A0A926QLC1_9BACL|nr:glycerophosphodiester phosphodiesterase family protein [Paenibacillus sedimenti]MBD0382269.1 glycerophosphodiester phosphodiesterase [Paenibacillus sedimenti]
MIDKLANSSSLVVAGHRGYKSTFPENTLLAFREALALGVGMLEFDLRLTQDGVVVVIHDETVDRTTNGTGPVDSLTLAEIQRLDAGGWFAEKFEGMGVPSLDELCKMLQHYPDLLLNVEIKPSVHAIEVADRSIAMLKTYGYLDRCVFTSFDAAILAYLHDEHGLKTQGFEAKAMSNFEQGEQGTYAKMWAIAFPMNELTAEKVQKAKDRGLLAWCYCPDTEEQVSYALKCGVTLMTCNDPVPALAAVQLRTAQASE